MERVDVVLETRRAEVVSTICFQICAIKAGNARVGEENKKPACFQRVSKWS